MSKERPSPGHMVLTLNQTDAALGDLTDGETAKVWLHRMHSGEIIGLVGEPPHDTWIPTERMIMMDEEGYDTAATKQYRTKDEPWGVRALSLGDYDKLSRENAQMRVHLHFMYLAVRAEISALLVHPWWCVCVEH